MKGLVIPPIAIFLFDQNVKIVLQGRIYLQLVLESNSANLDPCGFGAVQRDIVTLVSNIYLSVKTSKTQINSTTRRFASIFTSI